MRFIKIFSQIKRLLFVVFILSFSSSILAQEASYKVIDSTTFSYYQSQNWKSLAAFGKANEADYYYYNVRMGMAYYNLKQFYFAEEYFLKALENNENSYARTFLFWTYLNMGETVIAEQVYGELPDEVKSRLDYKKGFMEAIYVEAGVKIANSDDIGEIYYGSLVLSHNLGKRLKLQHSFTPFSQLNTHHQNVTNWQYNAFLSYQLKNTNIGLGGMFAKTNLFSTYITPDYSFSTPPYTGDLRTEETIITNTNSFFLNISHRMKRVKLNVNLNFVPQNTTFNYAYYRDNMGNGNGGNETAFPDYDSVGGRTAFIPSIGLSYFPKFTKDRFSIGAEVFLNVTDADTRVIFKPNISILFTDKLWLNASYLEINHQLFADYSTSIIYNRGQETKRFSTTVSYLISPKIIINATYLNESIHDNLFDLYYTMNSVFVGASFKF